MYFFLDPSISNLPFTIWEHFLQFQSCKCVEIDAIGIKVAQQIKLSGCLTKGMFIVKNAFLLLLTVKLPFVGQPDNFIC